MELRQFSRNSMYVSIPGKLSEIHLHDFKKIIKNRIKVSWGILLDFSFTFSVFVPPLLQTPWLVGSTSAPLLFQPSGQHIYVALSDPGSMKFQQWLGPFHMDWRTTMHANRLLTIFQECLHMYYSWKIVRKPFACMVVLQSMWIGPEQYQI